MNFRRIQTGREMRPVFLCLNFKIMNTNSSNSALYKTTDLSLCAVISLFKPIENIEKSNGIKKSTFVFILDQEIENIVDQYWRGEIRIDPRRYFEALRAIKVRLYE